ncbi:hypothetical protein ACXYUI_33190, partial [Klebsiella pneumoniae]
AVAVIAAAGSLIPIMRGYARYALTGLLAPQHRFAGSEQDPRTVGAMVTQDFPRDPRGHLIQARVLIDAKDLDGAER